MICLTVSAARRHLWRSAHRCTAGPPWHLARAVSEVHAVAFADDDFEFAREAHALCQAHADSIAALTIWVPHDARIEYESGELAE